MRVYILRGASEVVTAKPTLKPLSGEAMGIVDRRANTDVLIEGDKIVKVSKNIEAPWRWTLFSLLGRC